MKYALLGFGLSNRYAAQWLLKNGEEIFVSEGGTLKDDDKKMLEENGIKYEEGVNSEKLLEADVILTSPSVRHDFELLLKAKEKGILVETELTYFLRNLNWNPKVIAVTGSVGKSTTVAMINHILSKYTSSQLTGNFGIPIAQVLVEGKKPEFLVVEISSFQLYWANYFRPNVAVITNIYPNHLDWHPTMEHYWSSKAKITKDQTEEDWFMYNPRDEEIFGNLPTKAKKIAFKVDFKKNEMPFHIRINQNVENVAVAKEVMKILGYEFSMQLLEDFQPLPHRMEYCGTIKGIHCYNDSKATNATAVIKAVENFDENLLLIIAGKGKKEDYTQLCKVLKPKVKKVAVVGPITDDIEPYFKVHNIPYIYAKDIPQAVRKLVELGNSGNFLLLSPGGASYDAYKNFEERGEHFKKLVAELRSEVGR